MLILWLFDLQPNIRERKPVVKRDPTVLYNVQCNVVFLIMAPFDALTNVGLWDEITASVLRVEVSDVSNVDRQAARGLGGLSEPWEREVQ